MLKPTLALALQATPNGGSLAFWGNLALVVIAVAVVAVAVISGVLMLRFNRILSEIQRSTRQNFGPVSDRARSISDNVEFITQALRTDVEKLNASVRSLSDRLQQASDRMEERVEEFNALMSVVQGEAEDIFLDTASTVRGVREGARAIAGASGGPRRPRPEPGSGSGNVEGSVEGIVEGIVERSVDETTAAPVDEEKAVSAGED